MSRMEINVNNERKGLLQRDQEVQKRYWRRRIFVCLSPYARSIALKVSRYRILLSDRKRKKALEGAFSEVVKTIKKTDKDIYPSSYVFLNLALYFLIANRDIQSVKIDALTHPDEWHRSLDLRIIALTIHEWNVAKVSGRKLYEAMNVIDCSDELRSEVNESLKLVRKAQKSAEKVLKELRNSVIAHRDEDAFYQYQTIKDLPSEKILAAATTFYEASQKFYVVLPKLIVAGSSRRNLIKQIVRERC